MIRQPYFTAANREFLYDMRSVKRIKTDQMNHFNEKMTAILEKSWNLGENGMEFS